MEDRDYYAILGVDPSSSLDELARAYRRLAREHHPDLHPGDADADRRFKEINEAYQVLSNPEKRAQYDLQLASSHPSWSPIDPSQDEQAGFAQQEDFERAKAAGAAAMQQMANDFAAELREALLGFGEELDEFARTLRDAAPDRRGRQGFPPPPPKGRPPGGGRPPRNGRPPNGGKPPRP